ncbi:Bromodomain and PHD finger-containing protein 3 [Nymphaea thermarum]|nr:Bromodomain and PHD finger-containing protein 3 [Nymphaea thermarum]
MGKIVAVAEAKTKKKKKGRPSLVDLQKRSLLQQQQQQEQDQQQQAKKRNPNPSPSPSPIPNSNQPPNHVNSRSRSPASKPDPIPKRITRRQASQIQKKDEDEEGEAAEDEEEDDDEDDEEKKQKKLKFVLRLSRSFHPLSASSLESSRDRVDAEASGSDDESENGEKPLKKRKIDAVSESKKAAVCNGSAGDGGRGPGSPTRKADKKRNDQKGVDPTPEKTLMVCSLSLLTLRSCQLPDYHDIIQHPMDFSTIRKKLNTGVYTTLEAFESDVFLICSNAMHYNAPETIYFRQARAIQDLAKKNFQNLRQDGHGTEQDSRPQRGRPSLVKKFMRQSAGKSPFETAGSDSDAALANAGENSPWSNANDARKKTAVSEKPSNLHDTSIRASVVLRNSDSSTSLAENKYEKTEEASCINHRVINLKQGRKPNISEENRRATYKLSTQLACRPDPVFSILDVEKKQLLPVGVHIEHAYARSLARFAASLGPIAWRVAARKIERVLPPGMKFGPGWVGEVEAPPSMKSLVESTPAVSAPIVDARGNAAPVSAPTVDARCNVPPVTAPAVDVRCNVPPVTAPMVDARCNVAPVTAPTVDARCNVSDNTQESLKAPVPESQLNPRVTSPHLVAATRMVDANEGFGNPRILSKENTKTLFNPAVHGARFPFQHHQNVSAQPSLNGFTGGYPMAHLAKQAQGSPVMPVIRPPRQQESIGLSNSKSGKEAMSSRLLDMANRNNIIQATPSKQLAAEQFRPPSDRKARIDSSENSKPENAVSAPDHSDNQFVSGNGARLQASWRGLSLQQKLGTTPPDLNIGFQPPGSPVRQNSGVLTETQQPDLALQL